MLGRKVSLGKTSVSVWSGIALRADALHVGAPLAGGAAGAPTLDAGATAVHVALWPLLRKDVQARSITVDGARGSQDAKPLLSDLSLPSALRLAPDGTLEAGGRLAAALDLLAARPRAEASFATTLAGGTLTIRSLETTMGPARFTSKGSVAGIGAAAPRARLDLEF